MTYETEAEFPVAHIRPGEGIGAALMGGTGLGLGLALGSSRVTEAFGSRQSLGDTPRGEQHSALAIIESRLSVESREERGIVTDTHSFTSSPRSAVFSLPMSPMVAFGDELPPRNASDRPQMRKRAGTCFCM